jgi:hypothetical protein
MKNKLQTLAEIAGYGSVTEMLLDNNFSSIVPAICMNPNCDATYDYEPDCDSGYCEECHKNSVQSCLVIAGII